MEMTMAIMMTTNNDDDDVAWKKYSLLIKFID